MFQFFSSNFIQMAPKIGDLVKVLPSPILSKGYSLTIERSNILPYSIKDNERDLVSFTIPG